MTIASRWRPAHAAKRAWDVVAQGWYLGFTAFGGPPVHFKIVRIATLCRLGALGGRKRSEGVCWKGARDEDENVESSANFSQFHDKYVNKLGWVDEQMVYFSLDA